MKFRIFISKRSVARVMFLVLLLPFIFPVGVQHLYSLNSIIFRSTMLSSVIIICIYIYIIICRYSKINRLIFSVLLFSILLVVITTVKEGAMQRSVQYGLQITAIFMWADVFFQKFGQSGLRSLVRLMAIFAIVNTAMLLISPEYFGAEVSYRRYCFISNDNSLLPFLLPAMIMALIYIENFYLDKRKFMTYIIFAVFSSSIYLTWTGTGVVLFTFTLLIIIFEKTGIWRAFNARRVIFISVVSVILFVRYQIQDKFLQFFTAVQKDTTFSGRIIIWGMAFDKLKDNLLTGFGMPLSDLMFNIQSTREFTSHNQFLQIMLWGGVILLGAYILIILTSYRNMYHFKNKVNGATQMLCNIGLFGMLYYFVFEVHENTPLFWVLLVLVYHINEISVEQSTLISQEEHES